MIFRRFVFFPPNTGIGFVFYRYRRKQPAFFQRDIDVAAGVAPTGAGFFLRPVGIIAGQDFAHSGTPENILDAKRTLADGFIFYIAGGTRQFPIGFSGRKFIQQRRVIIYNRLNIGLGYAGFLHQLSQRQISRNRRTHCPATDFSRFLLHIFFRPWYFLQISGYHIPIGKRLFLGMRTQRRNKLLFGFRTFFHLRYFQFVFQPAAAFVQALFERRSAERGILFRQRCGAAANAQRNGTIDPPAPGQFFYFCPRCRGILLHAFFDVFTRYGHCILPAPFRLFYRNYFTIF